MDMKRALHELGVRDDTLSSEEKGKLDRDGFLPLPGILSPEQAARLGARLDELIAQGKSVQQQEGVESLDDVIHQDPMFEVCITQPRVLAAMAHVLGTEFRLFSVNSRNANPGYGSQELHVDWDWDRPVQPGDYFICNSIWALVDFTETSGSTRVVPGSHRSGKVPRQVMSNLLDPHPDQITLVAPVGTVIVFNSHLWHGGTHNAGQVRRWALHSAFVRRDQEQQTDQRTLMRPETYARLGAAERCILDV
jgi:ectoine hydroxylase-related dioxygenase (phytanoyl-CoA dioxygenase family)